MSGTCCVCKEGFGRLFKRGVVCIVCGIKIHERCTQNLPPPTEPGLTTTAGHNQKQKEAEHHVSHQAAAPSPARSDETTSQQTTPAPQQTLPSSAPMAAEPKPISWIARIVDSGNDAAMRLERAGDIVQYYEAGYERPSLLQALRTAGIGDAEAVAEMCIIPALRAEQNGALHGTRLTAQDATAVALWTFSFGESDADQQRKPSRLVNAALAERNAVKLGKLRGLIFLLLFGLRGLPRARRPVLYRGIRQRVDLGQYRPGNTVTWSGFSSTTTNLEATRRFLAGDATGKCEGTLFQIRGNAWGYDVQPFSFFPHEEEIVMEPEIDLRVVNVLAPPDNDLIVVDLDVVRCPLLLESLIPLMQPWP